MRRYCMRWEAKAGFVPHSDRKVSPAGGCFAPSYRKGTPPQSSTEEQYLRQIAKRGKNKVLVKSQPIDFIRFLKPHFWQKRPKIQIGEGIGGRNVFVMYTTKERVRNFVGDAGSIDVSGSEGLRIALEAQGVGKVNGRRRSPPARLP